MSCVFPLIFFKFSLFPFYFSLVNTNVSMFVALCVGGFWVERAFGRVFFSFSVVDTGRMRLLCTLLFVDGNFRKRRIL